MITGKVWPIAQPYYKATVRPRVRSVYHSSQHAARHTANAAGTSNLLKKRAVKVSSRTRIKNVLCSATRSTLEESTFTLSSGLRLEVITAQAADVLTNGSPKPQLVFIHGSYHAAWCWAAHWMAYFAERGYTSYAMSLRGQGRGDHIEGAPTLDDHTADVGKFLNHLEHPAVLLGHSFGGLVVQRYAGDPAKFGGPAPAGLGLLCSVPPYGNGPMIGRFLMKKPIASIRLTWSFAARAWDGNPKLCKETFFSNEMPEALVVTYMEAMAANSRGRLLDLSALNKLLPLTASNPGGAPVIVMGGEEDFCVDVVGVEETAEAYGVKPVIMPGMAHDIMLDVKWKQAAEEIYEWLEREF